MNEEDDCEDVDQESEKVSTSDLLSDIEFDIERLEFDNAEREIVDEMQNQGLYRISSFSYTLQLVLAYLNICRKRKGSSSFSKAISSAKKLVGKFNNSSKATEQLITKTGLKLRADVATRWSSTYIMIDRLLKLKTAVTEVTNEIQWDNLSNSEIGKR